MTARARGSGRAPRRGREPSFGHPVEPSGQGDPRLAPDGQQRDVAIGHVAARIPEQGGRGRPRVAAIALPVRAQPRSFLMAPAPHRSARGGRRRRARPRLGLFATAAERRRVADPRSPAGCRRPEPGPTDRRPGGARCRLDRAAPHDGPAHGRLRTIGGGMAHAPRDDLLPESPRRDPVRRRGAPGRRGLLARALARLHQPGGRRLIPRRDRPRPIAAGAVPGPDPGPSRPAWRTASSMWSAD